MDGTRSGAEALKEADRAATEWNEEHAGIYAVLPQKHGNLQGFVVKVWGPDFFEESEGDE